MLYPQITTDETAEFIEKYLDVECHKKSKSPFFLKERWDKINVDLTSHNVNPDHIADYICKYLSHENYWKFVNTLYWKIVADWVKLQKKFMCVLCWSTIDMRAHHPNYDKIHGYEIQMVDYLVCLCDKCHNIHHDGIPSETKNENTYVFKSALITEKYIGYQLSVLNNLINEKNRLKL